MRVLAGRLRTGLTVLTGTGAGASVVLAFLVVASVFVAVATPRASLAFRTRALQRLVSATAANGRSVIGSLDMQTVGAALGSRTAPAYSGINGKQFGPIGSELKAHLSRAGHPADLRRQLVGCGLELPDGTGGGQERLLRAGTASGRANRPL